MSAAPPLVGLRRVCSKNLHIVSRIARFLENKKKKKHNTMLKSGGSASSCATLKSMLLTKFGQKVTEKKNATRRTASRYTETVLAFVFSGGENMKEPKRRSVRVGRSGMAARRADQSALAAL